MNYWIFKSEPDEYGIDHLVEIFPELIPTKVLKGHAATAGLSIFKQGRLSIAPVSATQWKAVRKLRAQRT